MSRELLFKVTAKDFLIEHIRGSGPGGQHRNKTSTGVRLTHPPSGARGEATDNRSQDANKRAAFARLRETHEWQMWLRERIFHAMGQPTLAEKLEKAMGPENIRTQALVGSQWVDID